MGMKNIDWDLTWELQAVKKKKMDAKSTVDIDWWTTNQRLMIDEQAALEAVHFMLSLIAEDCMMSR